MSLREYELAAARKGGKSSARRGRRHAGRVRSPWTSCGFTRVRHYGRLSPAARERYAQVRQILRAGDVVLSRPAHPRPGPAAAPGKLLRHRHPRMKLCSSSRISAQPVLTSSKFVRPGPGGACPEAIIFALWPLKTGFRPCCRPSAEPGPGARWAVKAPARASAVTPWQRNPDISEGKRPEILPTHAPATPCS